MGLWLVCALVEILSLMHAGDFQRRLLLLQVTSKSVLFSDAYLTAVAEFTSSTNRN